MIAGGKREVGQREKEWSRRNEYGVNVFDIWRAKTLLALLVLCLPQALPLVSGGAGSKLLHWRHRGDDRFLQSALLTPTLDCTGSCWEVYGCPITWIKLLPGTVTLETSVPRVKHGQDYPEEACSFAVVVEPCFCHLLRLQICLPELWVGWGFQSSSRRQEAALPIVKLIDVIRDNPHQKEICD